MPDLSAQLRLQFGVEPAPITFSLEVDERDALLNSPVQVDQALVFNWFWSQDEFDAFYRGKEVLKVLSNGYTHVRLYAPEDYEADLVATELPVAIKALDRFQLAKNVLQSPNGVALASEYNRAVLNFEDMTKHPLAVPVRIRPPQPAPPSVEFVGIKETAVLDSIEFNNQRTATMRYNYVKDGFEVAYASSFVTQDGRTIDKPIWVPDLNGMFILKEPAFGALVIRYPARYRLYKVNYGLPSGMEYPALQLAWLQGDVSTFPMPPVTVLAIAQSRGRVTNTSFGKQIFPSGATLASWTLRGFEDAQNNPATLFTESSSTIVQRQLVDANNPDNIVTVEDKKTITLVDEHGVSRTFRFV